MGVWLKHLSGEGNDNVISYEIKEKLLDDSWFPAREQRYYKVTLRHFAAAK